MNAEEILEKGGLKPTANRILVVKALLAAEAPASLIELETTLETLDRSSISRVLTLLNTNGVVHEMEDGRGVAKYELCRIGHHHDDEGPDADLHPHFFCEKCQRVYCFDELSVPRIPTPEGFTVRTLNYMLKGICPNCKH